MSGQGARRRVVLTGAEGVIGSVLRGRLDAIFELVPLTRAPQTFASHVADLTSPGDLRPAFAHADAVIHLAGAADVEAPWAAVLPDNIVGTYNVFEAARAAGVPRVVLASSNHAIGMYEVDGSPDVYRLDDGRTFDASVPVRPDSLYGVSKVFGEALGRMYVDVHGMSVVCLRIGAVLADDDPSSARAGRPFRPLPVLSAEQARQRMRAVWLSHRDCAALFRRAVEADVQWATVFGTSRNPRRLWDLDEARDLLGYEPLDSAPA